MALLKEKLRLLRKQSGATLEQFAELVGTSKSTLWELENKDASRPSAELIMSIARQLKVTPEFLMDDSAASPTPSDRDEAFYRLYRDLDDEKKQQLQDILQVLDRKR